MKFQLVQIGRNAGTAHSWIDLDTKIFISYSPDKPLKR